MNARSSTLSAVFAGLLGLTPVGWAGAFSWDDADNSPPYDHNNLTFNPGLNGGSGFTAWTALYTGLPSSSGQRYLVGPSSAVSGSYSWGLSGTYTLGRGLQSALLAGSWTLRAAHHVVKNSDSGFSGFTLKSSATDPFNDGELLRFGFDRKADSRTSGIVVSTDKGIHYTFLNCGWADGKDDILEYSVSWTGHGQYTLTVNNTTEGLSSTFSGTMAAGSVAMLGVGNYGAYNEEKITFDSFTVLVPEPAAALPALAMAAWALGANRLGRRRGDISAA
jgi:hypothetical protein